MKKAAECCLFSFKRITFPLGPKLIKCLLVIRIIFLVFNIEKYKPVREKEWLK